MSSPLTGPVLVLLDHHDTRLRPPVLELLTAARSLSGAVHGIWFGDGLDGALPALGAAGVERVYRLGLGAAGSAADARLTSAAARAIAKLALAERASVVLLTSSFENKEIAAHLGVSTGAGVVVDAGGLTVEGGRIVADKTVFAGTWTTRCAVSTALAVVTLKPNSVPAEPATAPTTPEVVEVEAAGDPADPTGALVTLEERIERPESDRPDLGEAQVVVVGGRGTEGDFAPLEELADLLGGAVGATRVATDEGWIAHDAQIGQTGVTVSPRLYIGAGVSGAVHHRGGMQASGTIVAINSDPESPIFEIADYGIVGDLFVVLPQLTSELRRLLS